MSTNMALFTVERVWGSSFYEAIWNHKRKIAAITVIQN